MEKLTGQIMSHLPERAEKQIKGLALMKGQKAGEYVRDLIINHLREQEKQAQLMAEVFNLRGFDE